MAPSVHVTFRGQFIRCFTMSCLNNSMQQVLQSLMGPIIKSWNLSETGAAPWVEAAEQFRLPYWDWAQKQPYARNFGVPEICTLENVTVVKPKNEKMTMPNPLAKFVNPSKVPMGDKSMGKWAVSNDGTSPVSTSRHPACTSLTAYVSSGRNALAQVDMEFSQVSRPQCGHLV